MATIAPVSVERIELQAEGLDPKKAAAIFKEYGCLVVRGLNKPYVDAIRADAERVVRETIDQLDKAEKITEGWRTPNGALLLPAPDGYARDKQIMCLPLSYRNSSTFFQSAMDPRTLDIVEAILGPNIELFGEGQSLYKEPVGGHPKVLHQDAAYFEHKYDGPVACLSYLVDTDLTNGALHVVPGSFKLGVLNHEDTFSHLGLNADEWPWEKATPIIGKAGDAIFFHVNCIHGSKPNQSDKGRPIFINRWRRADDYTVIGATTVENRAKAKVAAEQARKENQLGLLVRGSRSYEPDRFRQ